MAGSCEDDNEPSDSINYWIHIRIILHLHFGHVFINKQITLNAPNPYHSATINKEAVQEILYHNFKISLWAYGPFLHERKRNDYF
jgi:hypothetical protein